MAAERAEERKQTHQDRARLYRAMADLASAQASMAQTHAQFQSNVSPAGEEGDG